MPFSQVGWSSGETKIDSCLSAETDQYWSWMHWDCDSPRVTLVNRNARPIINGQNVFSNSRSPRGGSCLSKHLHIAARCSFHGEIKARCKKNLTAPDYLQVHLNIGHLCIWVAIIDLPYKKPSHGHFEGSHGPGCIEEPLSRKGPRRPVKLDNLFESFWACCKWCSCW